MSELAFERSNLAWPSLVEQKPLRFVAFMVLYFMQGVPLGLSLVAIPAWLAAKGSSPSTIGAFVGFAMLPWSLKLVNGLLMDRFAYRPMGRRRAWVLVAQAFMAAILIALGIMAPGAGQVSLLASFCFALNVCATFNDVAVDGMAIDLVPEDERSAINGCMFGSQTVGIAATGLIGGQLLVGGGIAPLAFILAAFVGIASAIVGSFRERPGERLMPWTPGAPSPECEALQQDAWRPVVKGVLRAFASWKTCLFLVAFVLSMATGAFIDVVATTLAVQEFGWGSDEFSSFASMSNLISGISGIVLTGLIVKLAGLRRATIVLLSALVVAAIAGGAVYSLVPNDRAFSALFLCQNLSFTLVNILFIAWAMKLSDPNVAASQFALFMALPNFGRAALSSGSGLLIEAYGYAATYYVNAGLTLAALVLAMIAGMGRATAGDRSN